MRKFYKIGDGSLQVAKLQTKTDADAMIPRLKDSNHKHYYLSDKDLAKSYGMKTAMVKKIRKASGIPIREDRVLRVLRTLPTDSMYLDGILLALKSRISYNTLYVLMRNNKIPFLRKNKLKGIGEDDT